MLRGNTFRGVLQNNGGWRIALPDTGESAEHAIQLSLSGEFATFTDSGAVLAVTDRAYNPTDDSPLGESLFMIEGTPVDNDS